ncbi:phosphate transport system substrate-binding protein [Dyadobacter sp. BE34]|uniref:Phosphate transport system substrate-binding protein n=1 Tax=Dyadobacter fermentans TaxID=94254 RepID=A0ABU1QPG6_9BACT|nr:MULTISPECIES: substrate-binding domain-containing protein [Dyadobacter]MDR6802988.1 phosphate transport system substrate-binding protein [Dyadobacter fermentans]MDR7040730.1 phosphate transport system substrate-binding protein [Dyadobacter sp. BE242]MDR7195132.1 phosphate transport system substrate-binding protein [Dyadobacter sp. BE34]MDR7214323.1 phosphate transport system substrate-binding protein [Dyadobacter sp. BE31]MDR7260540.1 phosphate transport system substrate-binding protein [Dy
MKKRLAGLLLLVTLGIAGLLRCTSSNSDLDNPRQGTITIAADESFKPLINSLTSAYEGIYPDAHFKLDYKPEQEAIRQLLNDSARIIFATRQLNDKELEIIRKQKGSQKFQHIATDGLALVIGKSNPDSLITIPELKAIMEGKLTDWSQIKGGQEGLITLVFDNANASNLNFVLNKFGIKDIQKLRIISAGSNENVIKDVRENPTHLGFIGVNWISDGNSLASEELSKGIRVMGVAKDAQPDSLSDYIQPFQAGLEFKRYPLHRDLYIISREGYSGLGGGLMTYIARDVGGLIIQKMGLLPTVVYPRELEVKKEL